MTISLHIPACYTHRPRRTPLLVPFDRHIHTTAFLSIIARQIIHYVCGYAHDTYTSTLPLRIRLQITEALMFSRVSISIDHTLDVRTPLISHPIRTVLKSRHDPNASWMPGPRRNVEHEPSASGPHTRCKRIGIANIHTRITHHRFRRDIYISYGLKAIWFKGDLVVGHWVEIKIYSFTFYIQG